PNVDGPVLNYQFPFTATFTKIQHITCNGGSDGELIVTPHFGQAPFSYSWDHDANLTNPVATNLSAGDYTVSVTDGNNQTISISVSLLEPSSITINESITHVGCNNGNDGAINVTVTGGTGSKTYLWSTTDGSGVEPTLEDQSELSAGTYHITVTDENGCITSASYIVSEPQPITFGGSVVTDIVFPEGGNGAINLNISGGTPAYTFSWSGPEEYLSNDKDLDSLNIEGNYSIIVVDTNSCEADTVFTLLSNGDDFMAFINIKKDVSCYGGSDGEATVTVIGEQGTLHYVWKNSEGCKIGGDSPTVTGLIAGDYMVTVYDYRKCHVYAEVTITEPDSPLEGTIVGQDVSCYNEQNGIADLTVQGGTPPYTFEWSTGATSEDISGLAAGTYMVIITDVNACTFQTDVTISEPDPIQIVLVLENELLCYGDMSAVASVSVSGGTEPYSYLWNDPGSQNTATATNLGAGLYTVIVTDANGCIETGSIEIEEPPQIVISFNHVDVSCFGGNDGVIDALVQGGVSPYNYLWSNGGMGSSMNNIEAGVYSLVITDMNQCQVMSSIEILQPSEIIITSSAVVDITCFDQQDGEINIVANG
ncbi:MAG: SprB repeat-containing protein, partial [Bacteroidota bacterium]|nr:SprB repeat-containing protein [Bacteroidota bacterium]